VKPRCAQHGDENLRIAELAGEPVDDDGNAIAGIIDEQLLARRMALAHRHRQPVLEGLIEFAETRVAITARMSRDILLPHDRQRHVLALQRAVDIRPVGLFVPAVAQFGARAGEQPRFQRRVRQFLGSGKARPDASMRLRVSRTVDRRASTTRRAISRTAKPLSFSLITSRTRRMAASRSASKVPPSLTEAGTLREPEEDLLHPGASSRMVGDIIPDRGRQSNRNAGRVISECWGGINRISTGP